MAVTSDTTLQLGEDQKTVVKSVATGGGGGASQVNWGSIEDKPTGLFAQNGGSDGYSETVEAPAEITSFKPGSVLASSLVFSHVARHAWSVESLLIYAGTAPSADYSFDVHVGGSTQTVTLGGSVQSDTYSLGLSLAAGERLYVVSEDSIDSALADVHCSFDVLPG